jgi:Holin of 3TMs, for gene-transfer release
MYMSILALLPLVGNVLDKVIPDPQAAAEAKLKMLELSQKGELTELTSKTEIIKTEAASEHWLAATWRPILMLTFGGLIVARWLGYAAPGLSEAEVIKLWDIVELGIGGYVVGRSAEKIVPSIATVLKGVK